MAFFDDLLKRKTALFLDFDSVFLTPDKRVDDEMKDAVSHIIGAGIMPVVIVTDRRIADIDKMLGIKNIPVSGNHGAELRLPDAEGIMHTAPPMPALMLLSLQAICKEFGCKLEDKVETAVVHATNDAAFLAAGNDIRTLLAESFPAYRLWSAGSALHILSAAYNSATGVREMLNDDAFRKHKALYIGNAPAYYPGLAELAADGVSILGMEGKATGDFRNRGEVKAFLEDFSREAKTPDSGVTSFLAEYGFYRVL